MNSKVLTTSYKAGLSSPWRYVLSLPPLCSDQTVPCAAFQTHRLLPEANICWINSWAWVWKYEKQGLEERSPVVPVASHVDSREVAVTGFREWCSSEQWNSTKGLGIQAWQPLTSPLSSVLLKKRHRLLLPPHLATLGSLLHQRSSLLH